MAEVLITLAIIGIVAAITIPTLVSKYQDRALTTASSVFQKRLDIALKEMVTQSVMNGYSSTEDFVNNGLGKYMKIIKTCPLDHFDGCFAEKIYYGTEELLLSDLTSSSNFDKVEWTTTPLGVVFADGTTALILYNDKCSYQNPYNNQVNASECISIAYDVNGLKVPNSLNKDLHTINATLSKHSCIASGLKEATGVCVTQVVGNSMPTPSLNLIYKSECEEIKNQYGLKYCFTYNGGIAGADLGDPYASLVVHCGGINKVTSPEQLRKIAQYIYGTENIPADGSKSVRPIADRWYELFGLPVGDYGSYSFISNDERQSTENDRRFSPSGTSASLRQRGFASRVICVR